MNTLARIVLGLVFTLFSLDGVFHFIPLPPMPAPALAVITTLKSYGVFYLVKALELTAGLLLLSGRQVTLAVLLLAPILVNILWFDAALDPASLPVGLVLAALAARLLYAARANLRALFATTQRASP